MILIRALLGYWKFAVAGVGLLGLVGFYFHYQGIKNERNSLRVENSRLADINAQNEAVMTRLIDDHEKTLNILKAERDAAVADREELERIERDALEQEDGPLAANLRRLFSRLRNAQDGD